MSRKKGTVAKLAMRQPFVRILWRLGIRLPPLPFMPFWQVAC
nr:S-(hydroxymethyl)glutathione dehydrogenase [Escherichia coli]